MTSNILIILFFLNVSFKVVKSYDQSIPKHLLECYLDMNDHDHEIMTLPISLDIFLDIIRKIENSPYFLMDMGQLVNVLLKRFWRDGIELDKNVIVVDPEVIPYRVTGFEQYKYNLITQYMLPGTRGSIDFTIGDLTRTERCTLHRMLSRSVDIWERGDEFNVCENYIDSTITILDSKGFRKSSCPIEKGIVATRHADSISISNVLIAIAAGLNPMNIPVGYILRSEYYQNETIDNRWITLTGDLSEVLISQLPVKINKYFLGPGGRWNDTDIPIDYYMTLTKETLKNLQWQYTDAEILGSIDGLMMAEEANNWVTNDNTLRLSQLIESYYSKQYQELSIRAHACKRRTFFESYLLKNKNLPHQVKNFAQVMIQNMPNYIKNNTILEKESEDLVNEFINYTMNLLNKKISCPEEIAIRPSFKISLTTDTTWSSFETLKFITAFGEMIGLKHNGNKLSIIKGDNGKLIAHLEDSLGNIFLKWRRVITLGVPSLTKSLMTVRDLENSWSPDTNDQPYTHITLILASSTILAENDISDSISLLQSIRKVNPDMTFIYVTTKSLAPMYERLLSLPGSVDDKIIIKQQQNEILQEVSIINQFPRAIRPDKCSNSTISQNQVNIMGHANPGAIISYRIHPCYLAHSNKLILEILNSNYGNIIACVSRDSEGNGKECKEASLSERIVFYISNPCPSQTAYQQNIHWNDECKPIYIRISGKRSYSKCEEQSCRMPGDIPFSMSVKGMKCISGYPTCSRSEILKYNVLLVVFTNILIIWKLS